MLPASDQRTILIVEDNMANVKTAVDLLHAYSYRILVATNGLDGLERAELAVPDLVLMDINLPDINGIEACRRLKANPQTTGIPVIFMTAMTDVDDKVRALEAGGVDYITKPFNEKELLARVRTHLELRDLQLRLEQRVQEQTAELTKEIEQRRRIQEERDALMELVRQQSQQLRELTLFVLNNQGEESVEQARSNPLLQLTTREYEVLQLIAKGKTNAEIGELLVVSRSTVSTYRWRIMQKLEVETAPELIRLALEMGLTP
ncbi:MAG: response regulator [Candidatus Promineifilaceae bacterium]